MYIRCSDYLYREVVRQVGRNLDLSSFRASRVASHDIGSSGGVPQLTRKTRSGFEPKSTYSARPHFSAIWRVWYRTLVQEAAVHDSRRIPALLSVLIHMVQPA